MVKTQVYLREEELEQLRSAAPDELRVLLADKLHNARAILADYWRLGSGVWSRFNASRQDQLWYYRGCVTALREADGRQETSSLVDELDAVVTTIEATVS